MQEILQLLVSGLASGVIYALVASGFTLAWRATGTLNFAQGGFAIMPGFAVLMAINLGLPSWAAIVVALALAMLAFGAVFKRAVVDAVGRHGPVPAAIATAAIGFALGELAKSVFGADMRPRFALAGPAAIDVAGIAVPVADLAVIVAGLVALLIALTFLGDTRVGRAIQAVIQNRTAAQALGIRVGRMVLYVFVLNAALAGVASILLGLPAQPKAAGATSLTVAALAASVLGGFALRGTTGAALALGVIEQLLAGMVAAPYRPAVLPVVLVGVVAIRPQSLFGARKEKVA